MKLLLSHWSKTALVSFVMGLVSIVNAGPAAGGATSAAPVIFAKVGESVITLDEYNAAFSAASRAKFYHGKPPEQEVALLQREVADQLVTRILLLREAQKRGMRPDAAELERAVKTYDQRYAGSEQWKNNRAKMLPPLLARLEQDNLLAQLEKMARDSAKASEKQAREYYAAHREKFTEPEQLRVSVILLKVDPSSDSTTWKKAQEQAQALVSRARSGEDFASLARQHSGDGSAAQGGDMGYLHSGMLPEDAQEVLNRMQNGQISEALRLLEGFAVFRLTDRKAAIMHGFDAVKVKAQELAQREQSDNAWKTLIADLKSKTPTQVDQSYFLPMAK